MSARPGVAQASHKPRVDTSWQEQAACVGLPDEVFFPEAKVRITVGARRVCNGCPVRGECLEHALTHGEWFGVWGGLSVEERREIQFRRRQKRASA